MHIILIKPDRLLKYNFPNESMSQYWIKDNDYNNNPRDLILMERVNNSWFIISNEICYIEFNGKRLDRQELIANCFYVLKILGENNTTTNAYIYISKNNDTSFQSYY